MKYAEKLKDPRWQKKRLEVFQRDEFMCRFCGDTETSLCVHHLDYVSGLEPWEYQTDQLITLCQTCHNNEYQIRPNAEQMLLSVLRLKEFTADDIARIASALKVFKNLYPADVTATFLEYFFTNEDAQKCAWEMYWFYSHLKAEAIKKAMKTDGKTDKA